MNMDDQEILKLIDSISLFDLKNARSLNDIQKLFSQIPIIFITLLAILSLAEATRRSLSDNLPIRWFS